MPGPKLDVAKVATFVTGKFKSSAQPVLNGIGVTPVEISRKPRVPPSASSIVNSSVDPAIGQFCTDNLGSIPPEPAHAWATCSVGPLQSRCIANGARVSSRMPTKSARPSPSRSTGTASSSLVPALECWNCANDRGIVCRMNGTPFVTRNGEARREVRRRRNRRTARRAWIPEAQPAPRFVANEPFPLP
ncbi:MAG: hypothetical protein IPH13_21985 [Planctomycetes bacterium]|nr:hypothetical protein [Planctomycetota bacterium]